jgi:UDP-N-acetyl-D-mannosaminuronic acid dehydrogenase
MTIAIIGGLGHVGLPLGLVFAHRGFRVALVDSSRDRLHMVRNGRIPFIEAGAEHLLREHLGTRVQVHDATEALTIRVLEEAAAIIVTLGTPIDGYQNPDHGAFMRPVLALAPQLSGKLLVLRSTVFPGTTRRVAYALQVAGVECDVAYCPERILQGEAVRELQALPQIVSGITEKASERAAELFGQLDVPIVRCEPEEAELAKLFLNSWRYVSFAAANQFFQLAHELGVDYKRVEAAMKEGYSRADALPTPGFAAGPCLLKDTMQLVAASSSGFPLGQAARQVNERIPETIISRLTQLHGPIEGATIGILGMAFKADNDDTRDSLSFKLKKQLEFAGATVICSDEYAEQRRDWVTMESLLEQSSGIVLGVPHRAYHGLVVPNGKTVVDVWGVTTMGER